VGEFEKHNVIVTAYCDDDEILVVNMFGAEQWQMISSMASYLDMTIEEVVKGLGPEEVLQYKITPESWTDFFGLD
jgi:hypothetical protein